MTRDRDGHREYKIRWQIETSSSLDGPATVLQCPGLPQPGQYWVVDGDVDLWATCKLDAVVTPHPQYTEGERVNLWIVEQTFSTKGDDKRCKDQQWDDPLLVPDRISGTFSKYQEEATFDRFGRQILNSAFEQIRGPQVEFDANRPTVKISQNRAALEIDLFLPMVDTVNAFPLWGLPRRTIKLSNVSWERKFYGSCYLYYERTFEFDIRAPKSITDVLGFDRILLDEGSKALNGHWDPSTGNWVLDDIGGQPPSRFNPSHFIRLYDLQGNPMHAVLDGQGKPITSAVYGAISSASNTEPIVITTVNPHGLATGNIVSISQVQLNTEANGIWVINVLTSTTFELSYHPDDPSHTPSSGNATGSGGFFVNLSSTTAGYNIIQKYPESDFTLLGIPLTF
jgi:hypothetical protein